MYNYISKNIRILLLFSIILIVISNISSITYIKTLNININSILNYGYDIGITNIFIIWGYILYKYINNNKFNYSIYFKEIIKLLYPIYLISLLLSIILTNNYNIGGIISNIFMFQSFYKSYYNIYNISLNIISILFLYSLIAPFIYKLINKYKFITISILIIISILYKYFIYHYIFINNIDINYYYVFGKNIIGSIDILSLGMFIGLFDNKNIKYDDLKYIIIFIIMMFIYYVIGNNNYTFVCDTGILCDKFISYIFYSILGILLSICIYCFLRININYNNIIIKILYFISNYNYYILLFHIIIIYLIKKIPIYTYLFNNGYYNFLHIICFILCIILSILIGYIINIIHITYFEYRYNN